MPEKLSSGPRISHDASRVGAGLTRGPTRRKTVLAAAWSNTWPAPGATLDLDFANNRGFVRGVGQGGVMDAITFTRASIGKYVDSSGIVQDAANNAPRFDWASTAVVAQKNVLTATDSCNVSPWATNTAGGTFTLTAANQTDPLGGTTASTITAVSATTGRLFYALALQNSTQYTASIWVKLLSGSGSFQFYDSVNNSFSSIFTPTGTWQRFTFTFTSNANGSGYSGNPFRFISASGTFTFAVWGGQMELGGSATDYQAIAQPTTNTPLQANATCNGLLIEESRTNRLLWCRDARGINVFPNSQAFAQATWAKTGLGSSDNTADTVAPDGTSTASKITVSGGSARIAYTANVPTGTYTISVCLKKGATNVAISLVNATTATTFATFDPDAPSGNYTNLGNGWFRFWGSGTVNPGNEVRVSAANESIGEYFYLWGAQMEVGSSFTSYEATTANWAAFVKNNITAAKNQTGIDGVANAASSLTASADGGTCIQTITLASGSRTGSVYLKRITGTGNVQVSLDGSTWSTVDLSNGLWNRIVLSGTVTNPVVGIKLATNGDAVAMDYGQVEDGAFATTPILTTTATATRALDNASVSGTNFNSWMDKGRATVYCSFDILGLSGAGTNATIVGFGSATDDASFLEPIRYLQNGGFDRPSASGAVTIGTRYQVSQSFGASNNYSAAINGQRATANGASTALLTAGRMGIANAGRFVTQSSNTANCRIARLTFVPAALPLNAVQNLTGGAT